MERPCRAVAQHKRSQMATSTRAIRFPFRRSPNSSGSSASSTKRLRASPPPKPTPKRTSKTPAPSSKATSNPSSPSAARGGRSFDLILVRRSLWIVRHRTPKYQDDGIPALRPRDVMNGKAQLGQFLACVAKRNMTIQSSRYIPKPGDIAVFDGSLRYGRGGTATEVTSRFVVIVKRMCLYHPIDPPNSTLPLPPLSMLNGSIGREQATRSGSRSSASTLTLATSRVIPDSSAAVRDTTADCRATRCSPGRNPTSRILYQQKLAALDALKKSLLHQAFTGQL